MRKFLNVLIPSLCVLALVSCAESNNANVSSAGAATAMKASPLFSDEDEAAPLGLSGVGDRVCKLSFAFLGKDAKGVYSYQGEDVITDGINRTGYGGGCLEFCAQAFRALREENELNGRFVFVKSCQFTDPATTVSLPGFSMPPPPPSAPTKTPSEPVEKPNYAPPEAPQQAQPQVSQPSQPVVQVATPIPLSDPTRVEDACQIQGGAGNILFAKPRTKAECQSECQSRHAANPNRECKYGSEIIRPFPENGCQITNAAKNKILYGAKVRRFICLTECRGREKINPGRVCNWGAEDITGL